MKIDRIIELLEKEDMLPQELGKHACVSIDYLDAILPVLKKYKIVEVIFKKWCLEAGGKNSYELHDDKIKNEISNITDAETSENIVCGSPIGGLAWEFSEGKVINPSLDYYNGVMYVSQVLPFTTENGIERKISTITSEGKVLVLDIDSIKKGIDGIRITSFPDFIENRWSSVGMRSYLTGVSKPPDFMDVYTSIYNELEDKIEFKDPRYYSIVACWIIATYFFPLFDAFPYLYILGVKRSGKSKLLTASSMMAFNARMTAGMTTATLFRMAENNRSSLCIDELEGDKFSKDPDFRGLMLSGYKKGIKVPRARKLASGRIIIDEFAPYSPKMMVNIRGFDDVMEDRAIIVIMERGVDAKKINKMVNMNDPLYQSIRDNLYLLCMHKAVDVYKQVELVDKVWLNKEVGLDEFVEQNKNMYGKGNEKDTKNTINKKITIDDTDIIDNSTNPTILPSYIYNTLQTLPSLPISRDRELSLPLLTIASLCNITVFKDIFELLSGIFTIKKEEDVAESADNMLLETLWELVNEKKFYKVSNITDLFTTGKDIGNWANTRWVGRAIKRLGISKTKRAVHGRVEVLLEPEVIKRKCQDMGIDTEVKKEEIVEYLPKDEAIKKIIRSMMIMNEVGAPYQDVLAEAENQGIPDAEKLIEKMKQHGLLLEPKMGFLRLL